MTTVIGKLCFLLLVIDAFTWLLVISLVILLTVLYMAYSSFQYAYQPYLAKMVKQKFTDHDCSTNTKPKLKMLEIGLGCHKSGGMKRGTPGGSGLGWRHMFDSFKDHLDFELHIMEFDSACALKWGEKHKGTAVIHTGDASSEVDLMRVVQESGGSHDFDMIIDDASHINWHMIKTLEIMMPQVKMGGAYVVEDIFSSCRSWKANMGTHLGEETGGAADCVSVSRKNQGNATFFGKVIEWQKELLLKHLPHKDVNHIDFHGQIVVLEKGLPQTDMKWDVFAAASR